MDKIELKPCPFCSGEGIVISRAHHNDLRCFVPCRSCMAETKLFYKTGDAIEAWNRRAKP